MSNYSNRYKGLFEYEKHTSVAERSSLTAFFQNAGADTTMASQAVQHHLSGVIGGDGGGVGGATATGGMNAGSSSEELAGIPQSYDLVPFSGNDVETNIKHPLGVSSPRHPAGILPGDDARKIAGLRSPRRGAGSMAPATESESDLRHMMWVDQAMPGGRGSGAGGTFNEDFVPKQRLVFTANTEEERQAMVRRINRWLQSSNELRRKFGKNGGMPVNLTFSGMVDDLPPAVLRRHKATTEGLARRRRELAKLLKADQESYEERRKKNARMRLGRLPFKLL
eukprot:g958.t1